MDWSKAKSILIMVFLVLNIFLAGNLIYIDSSTKASKDSIEALKQVLSGKGVRIDCEVPGASGNLGMLNYEKSKFNRNKLVGKLIGPDFGQNVTDYYSAGSKNLIFKNDNTFVYTDTNPKSSADIKNSNSAEKYLKNYLSGTGIPVKSYVLDLYNENPDRSIKITLVQKYRSYLIFDNYIEAQITNEGIKMLNVSFKKVDALTNNKTNLKPILNILLTSFKDNNDLIITQINLGFQGYNIESGVKEYYERPVWRVRSNKGDMIFNAYDGSRIQ